MNSDQLYRKRRKEANSRADREVRKVLPWKRLQYRARIARTPDSASNSEEDIFCRLTRNRCVRRRGLFAALEQEGTNRRADAIGSKLLQSRNRTHYVVGSVVETDIHYPTDATLLWDTVRTVTRLVNQFHQELPRGVQGFTNRTRSARRRMQELERMSATQRHTQQVPQYRELLRITGQVLESARQVVKKAAKVKGVEVLGRVVIDQLRQQIATYCDLGEKVIDQTRRRVLDGEQVPTDEKVYSIFEDHTHLIKRGKQRQPVECGHKVFLAESAQGLITDYQIWTAIPPTPTMCRLRWTVINRSFIMLPICTPPIGDFTVPPMWTTVGRPE